MRARTPLAAAVVLSFGLTGCAAPPAATIVATGRVVADDLTVQAPTLNVPAVNLDAGFVTTGTAVPTTSKVPVLLSMASGQRVGAVEVKLGDSVRAGDVLLRFDDDALAQQVRSAKADVSVARAQVGVLDSAIDTTHDKEQDLRDKRAEVEDGIAKATKARKQLVSNLAKAKRARETVKANLAKVKKALKQLPPKLSTVNKNLARLSAQRATVARQLADAQAALAALPPNAPPDQVAQLKAAVRQLTAALAKLDSGIAQLKGARKQLTSAIVQAKAGQQKLNGALKQLNAGIPKLTKAIATIDTNLRKARDGLRQINRGIDKVRDARADLKRARRLARIAAKNTTAVDGARNELARAVVRAPADGVVSSVANPGDVVAPGATVAELARPAHTVRLWLAPDEVARVCVGDSATVAVDSLGAPATGGVSRVGPLAVYPPSYSTTGEIHLTRAVPVDLNVSTAMPPGVPADVQISPCSNSEVHA